GSGGVVNVDTAKIQELSKQSVRIADVRSPAEYAGGHIPGAENVPIDTFSAVAKTWDPTKPVIVYCQSGSRSLMAIDALKQLSYKGTIYHLADGIIAWTGPLDKGSGDQSAAPAPALKATATPVMYEFFTGW
ncbi:MAG: rhodanese-like domain-containing protein, partial [Actinobacteria bacterium]